MTLRSPGRSWRGLAFWGGLAVVGAALVAFLTTQGLERAGWWAGVIALFVAAFATIHQIRESRRRTTVHGGSPDPESAPGGGGTSGQNAAASPAPGARHTSITNCDTVVQADHSYIPIDRRRM